MKTSKSKLIYLVVAIFVSLMLVYTNAVSKTLNLQKEYSELKIQSESNKNIAEHLTALRKKQRYYDSILTEFRIDNGSIQHGLLKTLNELSEENDVKLISFLEPHIFREDNLITKTYQFAILGSYNNIMEVIYYLEQKTSFGEIINIQFQKKNYRRSQKEYLEAKVLLKSIG